MKALIFGISGQDGSYLGRLLLSKGYEVHGTSRDAEISAFNSLTALGIRDKIHLHSVSLTDFRSTFQAISSIRPDEIYNLAGQSSVGLSYQQPVETLESIATGTLNILEAIRLIGGDIRFYNAGSSECFGDTNGLAADETTPFHPKSPYAVAKSAAYWQVSSYRDSYGIYACSGILFNHESVLRPVRFVTRKIAMAAARVAAGDDAPLFLGDLSVKRDWGLAPEYVEPMWMMLQQESPQDFVISTGRLNGLEDFVACAFAALDLDWRDHVRSDSTLLRPSEIRSGFGCPDKARDRLGWAARTHMPQIAALMARAELARLQGRSVEEFLC
jgi:GDPmannose 4,6-dehydratase